jgi:ribosomal-protein-alanine N-acetyltransferase
MRYILRPMEPDDVPVVAAIDRLSFPTPWPASAFRHELQRKRAHYYALLRSDEDEATSSGRGWARWARRFFDAERGSRTVGYVGFRLQGSGGHITTIAVHPEFRGRGLGDLLLLAALDKMQARGVDVVTLEMRPSNGIAYQLYRKYGFEVKRREFGYYRDGEDAWVMAVEVEDVPYRDRLSERRQALERRLRRAEVGIGQKDSDPL